jgi:hypothetical protein
MVSDFAFHIVSSGTIGKHPVIAPRFTVTTMGELTHSDPVVLMTRVNANRYPATFALIPVLDNLRNVIRSDSKSDAS